MSDKRLDDLYRDPLDEERPDRRQGWYQPPPVHDRAKPPAIAVAFCLALITAGLGIRFASPAGSKPPAPKRPAVSEAALLDERIRHLRDFERDHGHFPAARGEGDDEYAALERWLEDEGIEYRADCRPERMSIGNEVKTAGWICLGHERHAAVLKRRTSTVTLRASKAEW
jgi:hypothetical protein